jgi:hypothetical protein
MKKLNHLFILTLTVLTVFTVNAFGQMAKDTGKPFKIAINAKGGIYNHDGTKLGYITKEDIVKDNKGQTLYFIDKSGNVIDAKGNKLGMAKKNGNYYNNDGQVVLQLKNTEAEKCEILDPQGHSWGYVHRNYKLHACAAHCFFLQQEKDKAAKEKALKKG